LETCATIIGATFGFADTLIVAIGSPHRLAMWLFCDSRNDESSGSAPLFS
jgi:hypothetical protein